MYIIKIYLIVSQALFNAILIRRIEGLFENSRLGIQGRTGCSGTSDTIRRNDNAISTRLTF